MRLPLLIVTLSLPALAAGVTATFEREAAGVKRPFVLQTEGDNLRVETNDGRIAAVLWDGKAKSLTMVGADKTYSTIDEKKMTSMRASMDAMKENAAKQMEAQMAKMPPERRAMMEQQLAMLKQPAPTASLADVKFTSKSQKRTVGTFSCEVYEASRDADTWEACVVPWKNAPLSKDDFKAVVSMSEFFLSMMGGRGDSALSEGLFGKELSTYPGFPVQTVRTIMGQSRTMSLVSVKRGSVDAAAFTVPAGYTEKQGPGMGVPPGPPRQP